MHRNGYFGSYLLRHLPRFTRGDRIKTASDGHQQNIDLAEHLQLIGRKQMAEVAQVGNTNIVDPKDEDGIFTSLKAMALIVIGRHVINRNVANCGVDFFPILAAGREAMKNDRITGGHFDAVVRPVLMAGGDDVLRQSGPGKIEGPVGISEDASSF